MAAKKKSTRKKAAKKKASPKPKAAKKKAAKKTKKASKPKKSPKAKTISVKRVAGKKKALKKAKPIGFAPKGPTIAPADGIEVRSMTINFRFELGMGDVVVKHFRASQTLGEKHVLTSSDVTFPDARRLDRISINGSSSGPSQIKTDRVTDPSTDEQNPLKFPAGFIVDGLKVLS